MPALVALLASLAASQPKAAAFDLFPAAVTRPSPPPARFLSDAGPPDPRATGGECRFRRRGPFMLLAAGGVQTFGALGYALAEYDHRHGGNSEEYAFSAGLSIMALVGGTAFALVSGTLLAKDAVAWRSCRQNP